MSIPEQKHTCLIKGIYKKAAVLLMDSRYFLSNFFISSGKGH